jgi:hypothetical protein
MTMEVDDAPGGGHFMELATSPQVPTWITITLCSLNYTRFMPSFTILSSNHPCLYKYIIVSSSTPAVGSALVRNILTS